MSAMNRMAICDLFRILIINIISAARFIDGGAPIFIITIRKSQKEIFGDRDIRPLERIILRVFDDSYIKLAMEKRPEEASPCANIIVKDPIILQLEVDISLARRRAM